MQGREAVRDLKLAESRPTHHRSHSANLERMSTRTSENTSAENGEGLRPRSNATSIARSRSHSQDYGKGGMPKSKSSEPSSSPLASNDSLNSSTDSLDVKEPRSWLTSAWSTVQFVLAEVYPSLGNNDAFTPTTSSRQLPDPSTSKHIVSDVPPLDEYWLVLANELFDMDQRHPYLWYQFALFLRPLVHVLFGKRVHRQLISLIQKLLSEKRVALYVRAARENLWPHDQWSEPVPDRPQEQQEETIREVRKEFLDLFPSSLVWLVSEETLCHGVDTLISVLRERQLNRHLIFNLMELIVSEVTQCGKSQ